MSYDDELEIPQLAARACKFFFKGGALGWKTCVDQDKTVAGLDEVAIDATKINDFNLLRNVSLFIFGGGYKITTCSLRFV